MTLLETSALLVNRIGWKNDKTVDFTLPASLTTTDSGLYFQDEHPAITLENIRSCQPVAGISQEDFETYLTEQRTAVIRQVLDDVFEKDYVEDKLLDAFPTAFDRLISLKMTIRMADIIITAARSNRQKRFGEQFVGKLSYDIFREAPNKFAIRGANYVQQLGVATRYSFYLKSVQRRFGQTRNMLQTISKGQVSNEQFDYRYNRY